MTGKIVFKTYKTKGDSYFVHNEITYLLLSKGFVSTGTSDSDKKSFFRYPSMFFSSKKPWTCVSELSVETMGNSKEVKVRIGMTFTKTRNFTVLIMTFVCLVIPVLLGMMRNGSPDFSPMSSLGIPAGFLVYYAVRGRVFRYFGYLIKQVGDVHGLHRTS
jgi:hypothetical protein